MGDLLVHSDYPGAFAAAENLGGLISIGAHFYRADARFGDTRLGPTMRTLDLKWIGRIVGNKGIGCTCETRKMLAGRTDDILNFHSEPLTLTVRKLHVTIHSAATGSS